MKELTKIVKDLEEKKKDWQLLSYDELLGGECGDLFCNLLDEVKKQIIENNAELIYKKIDSLISNKELVKDIKEMMDYILQPYFACEVLRNGDIDSNTVRMLFDTIFTRCILRFDDDAFYKYVGYGISKDKMLDIVSAIGKIIYKGIEGHYTKENEKKIFMEYTFLDETYADFFGDLYERYYKEMQINYIIDKLN